MAFFGGFNKSGDKKKSSAAGEMFKKKMGGALVKEQTFQQRLDNKVEKDVSDYLKAKNTSAAARGDNSNSQQITENTKKMLTILAGQKLQKEIKKEKKQVIAEKAALKKQKQVTETAKRNLQTQAELKVKQELEAAQQSGKSYFFGYTEE